VQPRAGRTQLVGRHGVALKVRVTAPPVDGRANEAAIGLLSSTLGVPASGVVLVSGAHSRLKRFRIAGLSAATVTLRIEAALSDSGTRAAPG
jgi:uncharacterized protein (TIGR00251 family)